MHKFPTSGLILQMHMHTRKFNHSSHLKSTGSFACVCKITFLNSLNRSTFLFVCRVLCTFWGQFSTCKICLTKLKGPLAEQQQVKKNTNWDAIAVISNQPWCEGVKFILFPSIWKFHLVTSCLIQLAERNSSFTCEVIVNVIHNKLICCCSAKLELLFLKGIYLLWLWTVAFTFYVWLI